MPADNTLSQRGAEQREQSDAPSNLSDALTPPPTDSRGVALLFGAGVCYVAAAITRRPLVESLFNAPAVGVEAFIERHALQLQLVSFAVLLPAILLLGIEAARPTSLLRRAFKLRGRAFAYGFIAALLVSLVLNWTNTWPFTWRWASSTTGAYAQLLLLRQQVLAVAVWAVTSVAIVPVLEEAIFRVGLLRFLNDSTHSSRFGIVASSLLFGAAHLGSPFWQPDAAHLVNAFWIFVGSLIIAYTTVRDAWNVSIALGSHIARNAIEFTLLLFAAGGAPH